MIGFKLVAVNTCMHDDNTEADDPAPDGSTLQIDGTSAQVLVTGIISGTVYLNANTSLQQTLKWMLFAKLSAQ